MTFLVGTIGLFRRFKAAEEPWFRRLWLNRWPLVVAQVWFDRSTIAPDPSSESASYKLIPDSPHYGRSKESIPVSTRPLTMTRVPSWLSNSTPVNARHGCTYAKPAILW